MNIAPFIRPIKLAGGTFYTFGSAFEDLTFTLSNSKKKFKFSKYALLKIPKIARQTDFQNYIQLNAIPGAYDQYGNSLSGNLNDKFAESFQNYCLNLETMLTARDEYNVEQLRTVSERVFFKWLKEIGAIRFREATTSELSSTSFGSRFVEENNSSLYESVVKYIGEINVINNVRNKYNSYNEIYIHVPTSHGSTKNILFNAIDDENYYPDLKIQNKPVKAINDEYIYGREYDDIHPAGLDFHGHWDSEGSFNNYWYDDNGLFVEYPDSSFKWWYDSPDDSSFQLEKDGFNNATNEIFAIGDDPNISTNFTNVKFKRSKLDGISLEFNPQVYTRITNDTSLNSISEYNASTYAEDFEFNAILVYYDLYDPLNLEDRVTNLFGVLFLDNVDASSLGGGEIPSLKKFKPNEIIQSNGNSYAFKLNVKIDSSVDNTNVEVSINDYNTFSLQLYLDALNKIKETASLLENHLNLYGTVNTELEQLKNVVYNNQDTLELETRIAILETAFEAAQNTLLNNENLVNLLERNYTEILNIYKNYTSVEVAYNLNVIKQGLGINIERNNDNYITINNNRQSFNLSTNPKKSILSDFENNDDNFSYYHNLLDFDNYLRITDGNITDFFEVDRDVFLFINDSDINWKKGQKMRISFEYGVDFSNANGNFNFYILTDALDSLNKGFVYSSEIDVISYTQFENKNNKPVIEIICINPDTYEFAVDIF